MATTDSAGFTAAFAGPAHVCTADTRTRRKETHARQRTPHARTVIRKTESSQPRRARSDKTLSLPLDHNFGTPISRLGTVCCIEADVRDRYHRKAQSRGLHMKAPRS